MKVTNLENFIKGWFIGNFTPSVFKTDEFEIAVKSYKAGDYEVSHKHMISTEITVISKGSVEMNGRKYLENDIIVVDPGEAIDFKAITDTTNIVIKIPCIKGDKVLT